MDCRLAWQFGDIFFPLQMMINMASDFQTIFSVINMVQAFLKKILSQMNLPK